MTCLHAPNHAAHDVLVGVVQPVLPCRIQYPVIAAIIITLHKTHEPS